MKKKPLVDKIYRLKRNNAPLSYIIPTRSTSRSPLLYFDEEKGINRPLRYARNQRSPFEDEQDGNAIIEPVIFEDGFLRVDRTNPVLQSFLDLHPMNGTKFEVVDNKKEAQEELDDIFLQVDALSEAKSMSIEQLEVVSRVLFNIDISRVSTAELRRDVIVYARNYPEDFLNIFNDTDLDLKSKCQQFISSGLLSIRTSRNKGEEIWFNTKGNKKKLLNVPYGEDVINVLFSYFKTDEGIPVLEYLEKRI
tara:strand:- start:6352 stop:7101 length:750 start_codon:yes stop_codon:yes gene_type:complete